MESLGLLITLTLGGLGMFLVVLVVTFVLAKVPKLSQLLTRTLEQDRDWFLWIFCWKYKGKENGFYIKIVSSGCHKAPWVWEIQWVWRVLPGGLRHRLHGAHDVCQQWAEGHLCHRGWISEWDFLHYLLASRTWRAASWHPTNSRSPWKSLRTCSQGGFRVSLSSGAVWLQGGWRRICLELSSLN